MVKNALKKSEHLKDFLDDKAELYSDIEYISLDPVSIPHQFSKKEDVEIAGFLTATIAWGQRPVILKNAKKLMHWMDNAPNDFILNFKEDDLEPFRKFVHRTFNGDDCVYFLKALQEIYGKGGLEKNFKDGLKVKRNVDCDSEIKNAISYSRTVFFSAPHLKRTEKHFSNPANGSAAKRLNMFLRWMVRRDKHGVDFGIWKNISPSLLICPLDVHSGRIARKLGLLKRKQNDWKAAEELTASLRHFNKLDPIKYDFALFGLGAFEKF